MGRRLGDFNFDSPWLTSMVVDEAHKETLKKVIRAVEAENNANEALARAGGPRLADIAPTARRTFEGVHIHRRSNPATVATAGTAAAMWTAAAPVNDASYHHGQSPAAVGPNPITVEHVNGPGHTGALVLAYGAVIPAMIAALQVRRGFRYNAAVKTSIKAMQADQVASDALAEMPEATTSDAADHEAALNAAKQTVQDNLDDLERAFGLTAKAQWLDNW